MSSALERGGIGLHERGTLPESSLFTSKPTPGEEYRLKYPEDFERNEEWEAMKTASVRKSELELESDLKNRRSELSLLISLLAHSSVVPQSNHQMGQKEESSFPPKPKQNP